MQAERVNEESGKGLEITSTHVYLTNLHAHGEKSPPPLNIGYVLIANTFFKHPIPTEAETEYAINHIEDVLMSSTDWKGSGDILNMDNAAVKEVFRKNGLADYYFSREAIEQLFSQHAYIVMGRPASQGTADFLPTDFALLLLLREITHHLNYRGIRFASINEPIPYIK